MLLKTAVDKESVDQTELVNVKLDFAQRIVQVSSRYLRYLGTKIKIVIKKLF